MLWITFQPRKQPGHLRSSHGCLMAMTLMWSCTSSWKNVMPRNQWRQQWFRRSLTAPHSQEFSGNLCQDTAQLRLILQWLLWWSPLTVRASPFRNSKVLCNASWRREAQSYRTLMNAICALSLSMEAQRWRLWTPATMSSMSLASDPGSKRIRPAQSVEPK